MYKIQILSTCRACGGKAYLPTNEEMGVAGHKYFRHLPCTACHGSGKEARWIDLPDFVKLLDAVAAENSKA
jgi:hypothetical protein